MRILHVINWLNPHQGGPPKIAASLAAAQAELGASVRLVSFAHGESAGDVAKMLGDIPGAKRVEYVQVQPRSALKLMLGGEIRRELRPHVAWADVLHLHNFWDPLLLATAAEARKQGKPYLVLLNGMLDAWSMQQSRMKKKVALALGYRGMLNRSAALHCGNTHEQREVEKLGITARCVIVANGIFPGELELLPAHGAFAKSYPKLAGRRYVLFMSRLHHKKGLDYLAEAFAEFAKGMEGVDLVVAGPDDGGPGSRADFEKWIGERGVSERVHVVGPLYGGKKWEALADAEAFILPTRQEGFSMAVTEALGCGLPCVTSVECHFPEVAEAGAGFVLELDAGAFAEALTELMGDEAMRKRMSVAARELVLTRFTWPRIAEQTLGIYGQLTGGYPTAAPKTGQRRA